MRRRVRLLLLSLILTACVAAPLWAGSVAGITNVRPEDPQQGRPEITLLHTAERFVKGRINPTTGTMTLEIRQTFTVDELPDAKALHVLLLVPAICRNADLSLSLGDSKLTLSACSGSQLEGLNEWLLAQETPERIDPDQVRFLRAPLSTVPELGSKLSLTLTCRIKPTQDGDALLFTVPQILHMLEPKPLGQLSYQIDVGPVHSLSVPGFGDRSKIQENTPEPGWRRVCYEKEDVPTADLLKEFIVRIVR